MRELRLQIHLGCYPAERERLQEVRVSFEIGMPDPPAACRTDRLADTVDYGRLSDRVREYCEASRFNTIEKLAAGCLAVLRAEVDPRSTLKLAVHKIRPPVEALLGGVVFEIESGPS